MKRPRALVGGLGMGFTPRANPGRFDAILMDVDNGPAAFTSPGNGGLYDTAGVVSLHRSLKNGGRPAVWSAWDDRKFEQRLRFHGFFAQSNRVRAGLNKGARHTVFLGVKQAGCSQSAGAVAKRFRRSK